MAGPGIRYWEITAALRRRGLNVLLAAPLGSDGADVAYSRDDGPLERAAAGSDTLLVTGGTLQERPGLVGDRPTVVDLYDPFLFENLQRFPGDHVHHEGGLSVLRGLAERGDFFLCAGERQRDLAIGLLTAWGRVNPATHADDPSLRRLVDAVPMGIPSEPPRHGPTDLPEGDVVLWNGGIWDWLDAETALRAVGSLAPTHPRLRLVFLGTRHPNPAVGEPPAAARARDLATSLGLLDRHVFFRDWTPYEQRGAYLLAARLGISLHLDSLETRYAWRTRLLDWVWAGLPGVVTAGDELGERLVAHGLATAVPCGDVAAAAQAISAALSAPRAAPTSLARALTWDHVVEPLACFLEAPRRAADR